MARPVNRNWDFVEQGMILQYKEDSLILIVEVVEDNSTDEVYNFLLRPIAGNYGDMNEPFTVSFRKDNTYMFSGMTQLYKDAEYMPLPIGKTWPFIFDEEALNNSKFIWKEPVEGSKFDGTHTK